MPDLASIEPPEPPKDWTVTHTDGETIRGYVTKRGDFTTKDGTPFSVIDIDGLDGKHYRVPLGRADLRPLVEHDDVSTGDGVVIKYWFKAGQKFVYSYSLVELDGLASV